MVLLVLKICISSSHTHSALFQIPQVGEVNHISSDLEVFISPGRVIVTLFWSGQQNILTWTLTLMLTFAQQEFTSGLK